MTTTRTPRYTVWERGEIIMDTWESAQAVARAKDRSYDTAGPDYDRSVPIVVKAHWLGDVRIVNWRMFWVNGQLQ